MKIRRHVTVLVLVSVLLVVVGGLTLQWLNCRNDVCRLRDAEESILEIATANFELIESFDNGRQGSVVYVHGDADQLAGMPGQLGDWTEAETVGPEIFSARGTAPLDPLLGRDCFLSVRESDRYGGSLSFTANCQPS